MSFSHAITRTARLVACAVSLAAGFLPAEAADPEITRQPVSGLATYGESFGFSVEATGTAPLTYQWQLGSEPLSLETNNVITINDVTNANAGSYSVVVTSGMGSVTSAPALLTVQVAAPRTVRTGTVTGGGQATVPLILSGNGREVLIGFSLAFDTNIFANPTFEDRTTNSITGTNFWSIDNSRASEGLIGLFSSRALLDPFPPRDYLLGNLHFDFVTGNDPLTGRLSFTNIPTAIEAHDTNQLPMILSAVVAPQAEPQTVAPQLNRQSGLFEQVVRVAYPGAEDLDNVDLLIAGLGVDSLTNAITVYNSIGLKSIDSDSNGELESVPFVSAGPFLPGETRELTIEFHVPDHVTVPGPDYRLLIDQQTGFTIPAAATPLNITTNRYVNGTFIIQWPSRTKYRYFIQYAPTLTDLINNTTNSRVASPTVPGTGYSLQWIDNGPPKTESPPVDGDRFYRVLELPTE